MSPAELRAAIQSELLGNLLPFWRERSVDPVHGGFIGEMSNDGTVQGDAPKGLILNSRLLWSFAAVYRSLGDDRDLALARRAYDYLLDRFKDPDRGGFFWRLDASGQVVDDSKKIYGQAFSIYALSEYHRATGELDSLVEAKQTFDLIERHAHDDDHRGYIETLARDWSAADDLRLSDKDMDSPKSMNNHLHVLEAYTNLFRVWPDPLVATRLDELIDLFDRHIVGRSDDGCHLRHFFDEKWNVCSQSYSYGHDIEAAWLLSEAAEVLGDEPRQALAHERAVELARSVLKEALGEDGGLAYEGRDGKVTDPNREWWCQAEAVVGFWQAFQLTGDAAFAEAAERVWRFIDGRVVDRENGEWFWRVFADGSRDDGEPKVSEWKGPYHNTRMCLEMLHRIDNNGSR
jgi:mannobiose 2-epimerase